MADKNKSEGPFDVGERFNSIQTRPKDDKLSHRPQKRESARISAYDRLNALIRSELYQSDYSAYVVNRGGASDFYLDEGTANYNVSLSKAGKALCKKWGLFYPVTPSTAAIEDDLFCLNRPIEFIPDPTQWKTSQANTFAGSDDKIFTHINGKLALLIDLSFPREKLRSEFDRFLNRWGKKQQKGRHEDLVNKWDIYDEVKKGISLLKITRRIFKSLPDEPPAYNAQVDRCYRQVRRAYKSAREIIGMVEQMRAE
jgi:hypothetical protein